MSEVDKNLEESMSQNVNSADLEQALKKVNNFGQFREFIRKLDDSIVGSDGLKYPPERIEELLDEAIEETKSRGKIDMSRLSQINEALAKKVLKLIDQWYKDNAELELDA